MRDLDDTHPEPPAPGIILAEVGQSYWLLEGEEHLSALLSNQAPYPRPVRCLRFDSDFAFRLFQSRAEGPASLWGINPAIIDRLKRHDELEMVPFTPEGPGEG
ncbi:hypothetical protein [Oceanicella sp. SM1341]|uniref:hypothetical protein n=1 Tax=Oceanicella sp. SM1341 TaxID=1548889 RepID=UPI000E530C64|nr:hypothetical protein [Oceanicella sp. SM1341]